MKIANKKGHVTFHREGNEIIIDNIIVNRLYRRSGIGEKLMKRAISAIKYLYRDNANVDSIALFADSRNDKMSNYYLVLFYESLGFSENSSCSEGSEMSMSI